MSISNRFFVQTTAAFLLIGLAALTGIVGMTFWLSERAQLYFSEVIDARDVRSAAVELRNAVQTAESSQRGYLFTGNEIYLAPLSPSKTIAYRQIEILKRMLASRDESAAPVRRLAQLLDEKFSEMDQTIALKRERRDAEALAMVRTNRGKTLNDEANVYFSGIIRTADENLTESVNEEKSNAALLRLFSILGGIVILSVVAGAVVSVARYTRDLAKARDEVALLNAGLEERVKARTADLARATTEIQQYAHIISHDLRAPLVSIVGFTGEIEAGLGELRAVAGLPGLVPLLGERLTTVRRAVDEDMPEAIGFIRSSTEKMNSLISAILKLSREGKRILKPEQLDLAEVVRASATAIQHQLSEAGGELILDIKAPSVVTDRLTIEQVVTNILDNAVKYRSEQRPLRIRVNGNIASGDMLKLEIKDNGRGIAEQDQHRVFELFRRIGRQTQPGEGIGLSYVQMLIRNLGGDISLTSTLGEGTTFTLTLPRVLKAGDGAGV